MPPTVTGLIAGEARHIRQTAAAAALCLALLALPVALLLAWLLAGTSAWNQPAATPLLLELLIVAYAASVWFAVRRFLRLRAADAHVAAATEDRLALASGSLRGLLELDRGVQPGMSQAMFRRAEASLAALLASAPRGAVGGALRERTAYGRTRAIAALFAMTGLAAAVGFAAPQRARDAWAPLLHPVAHLSQPPLPALAVEPGHIQVARGGTLAIRIQAAGRTAVVLRWRAAGDVSQRAGLDVRHGVARGTIAPVDAPLVYWIEAPDGAVTDSFRATPVDPLLVSALDIEIRYPAYLGIPAERFAGEVPTLELPEGSELRVRGEVSRPLAGAALRRADGETRVQLHTDGSSFRANWTPRSSGLYAWDFAAADGAPMLQAPAPLEIRLIPDAPPAVSITDPHADGVFSPDLRQTIIADARDDHGIRSAALVSWRVSSLGDRHPPVEQAIPLDGAGDHFLLRSLLDAGGRRMLPGDTLFFFVRAIDNSPRRQAGVSRTMSLRIPDMNEIRQESQRAAEKLMEEAGAAARAAKQLATDTRDLSRQSRSGARAGASSGTSSSKQSGGEMQFRDAERARQILAEQDALLAKVEEMRARAEALQDAMQRAGLEDADLRERMNELAALYDQILTSELRQKLEALRNALQELDPQQVQAALEQLAQNQEQFSKQLDQSMELLRRAAAEQEMNELARQARELAAQQRALAEAMQEARTPASAGERMGDQQRDLATRADSLRAQIEALRDALKKQGESRAAEQSDDARDKVADARQQMDDAAQSGERDTEPGASAEKQEGEEAERGKTLSLPKLPQLPMPRVSIGKQESQGGSGAQPQQGNSGSAAQSGKKNAESEKSKGTEGQSQAGSGQAGKEDGGKQQSGGQQGGAQQGPETQAGGQQAGEKQGGQSGGRVASAGAAAENLEQAARTLESARQAMAEGWKQETKAAVQQSTNEALSLAERQEALARQMQEMRQQSGVPSAAQMNAMRGEQAALKQGLEAMGQNLADAGRRSAMVDRGVGAALGRSMLSMEQTLSALSEAEGARRLPVEEAAQTVEALNRLALALLQNQSKIEQSGSGTGMQEALERLAELAQQQGQLSGQSSSLLPMGLSPQAMGAQAQQLARQQQDIARRLGGVNNMLGGAEDVLGRLDELAREADQIARDLEGGRLTPETVRRQERLFHRLLDAGRTLERDETSEERTARRAGNHAPSLGRALDPTLLEGGQRYPAPTPEQLRGLSPAYRKLILDYFDRLNRTER